MGSQGLKVVGFSLLRVGIPAEFLKWKNPPFIFKEIKNTDENLKLVSQQYTTQSGLLNVQADGSILVAKVNHFRFQQDKG